MNLPDHDKGKGMKFLLVGNEPYSNFLTRAELRKSFNIHRLDVVSYGSEAIKLALSKSYDMVLLDYHLPDHDGLAVLNQFKKLGINQPVLMVLKNKVSETFISELRKGNVDFFIRNDEFPENIVFPIKKLVLRKGKKIKTRKTVKQRLEEERLDALTQTSMTIHHEVNNALTTIMGAAQLLLNGDYDLNPRVSNKVKIIEEGANRIKDTLVKLSHIIKPASVDVASGRMIDLKNSAMFGNEKSTLANAVSQDNIPSNSNPIPA